MAQGRRGGGPRRILEHGGTVTPPPVPADRRGRIGIQRRLEFRTQRVPSDVPTGHSERVTTPTRKQVGEETTWARDPTPARQSTTPIGRTPRTTGLGQRMHATSSTEDVRRPRGGYNHIANGSPLR
ncbi:unnamed protein product [Dicrocoelium dendriticum]|nr:unnamed protein product [Dicrocoelium dendriticum]